MRTIILTSGLASSMLLSGACSDTCGLGTQLNGRVYDAFVHPVEVTNAVDDPRLATAPGNGPVQLGFEWGSANSGPITVIMDGQAFDGQGVFYEQDCGNFSAAWSGVYVGPTLEDGTAYEYGMGASGVFQFYEGDGGTQVLAGTMEWKINWDADPEFEYYTPIAEVHGTVGGAAVTATE